MWTWKQMSTWCLTAACTTVIICFLIVHCNETARTNCDRRAEMIEKIAVEEDGGVFIFTSTSAP